ncbi:hypothetical protein BJX61DRAFT_341981 [Aspergillus egyptiacus]|nr:hypothetical protein BJX61DRAFT_341981 [Aspergillus egyptiacus]
MPDEMSSQQQANHRLHVPGGPFPRLSLEPSMSGTEEDVASSYHVQREQYNDCSSNGCKLRRSLSASGSRCTKYFFHSQTRIRLRPEESSLSAIIGSRGLRDKRCRFPGAATPRPWAKRSSLSYICFHDWKTVTVTGSRSLSFGLVSELRIYRMLPSRNFYVSQPTSHHNTLIHLTLC